MTNNLFIKIKKNSIATIKYLSSCQEQMKYGLKVLSFENFLPFKLRMTYPDT